MEGSKKGVKIPNTKHAVLPHIVERWSPRSFSDRPILQEELEAMVEAASWAPSSTNDQPWLYFYAHRGTEEFADFFDCLLPGNQQWAHSAATLLVSVARTVFASNGRPNRHAFYDVGASNALLLIQGASMGIYGHQLGGYDSVKTADLLNLPDGHEVACFIALGYLDDPEKLQEPFRTRELTPRSRKPLDEILKQGWKI